MVKRHAPASARNREPIAAVLREVLPGRGSVLEVASGTGEHSAYFAALFPGLDWQPTDPDPEALASIRAWRDESGCANLREPLQLDAAAEAWPAGRVDAVLSVNMVHSAPGPNRGADARAGRLLADVHRLSLRTLSPRRVRRHRQRGVDARQARHPEWGLRDLDGRSRGCEPAFAGTDLAMPATTESSCSGLTVVARGAYASARRSGSNRGRV